MIDPILKNSNILIVDDQPANIEILESFLVMLGYTKIKTTTDARKVIPLFQIFSPDLILLDLLMPYFSGFEVLQLLKPVVQANTFVPILVLAEDIAKEAKQKALSEGASDFLTKPFDLVEVGLRIRNLLFTKYLVQQLGSQNQILEQKVKSRTRELEQCNIELIDARDKTEASDRIKTAFMNNISREIRTPLKEILGFAPMVIDPTYSDRERKEFQEILSHSSKYLMQTITDYVDISLITSKSIGGIMMQFALGAVIDEIQKQFQAQCNRKGITLIIQKYESFNTVVIKSDKVFIKKILTHLMDNALKFTNEGNITLGVSIKIGLIEFFIKDTGIGICKEALPVIFDSFLPEDISTIKKHEGRGLGLSIVKGLVSLLGGTVSAESAQGYGSMFSFTVPWIEERIDITSPAILSKLDSDIRRPVLLVAEDEPYGFLLFELSVDNDYEIIRAEDGDEAVEFCKLIPEIQIVLMDLKLPKMNGLVATQEIKKFRKDLPIITLTAYAEAGIREKCLEAGCDEFLAKPISKMELLGKIQEFLIAV